MASRSTESTSTDLFESESHVDKAGSRSETEELDPGFKDRSKEKQVQTTSKKSGMAARRETAASLREKTRKRVQNQDLAAENEQLRATVSFQTNPIEKPAVKLGYLEAQGMGNQQIPYNGQMQMMQGMQPQPGQGPSQLSQIIRQKTTMMYNQLLQKGMIHMNDEYGTNVSVDMMKKLESQIRTQVHQWKQGVLQNRAQQMAHHGRTFTCFSLLPKELRLMIWEFADPPRLIEIFPMYNQRSPDGRPYKGRCVKPVEPHQRLPVTSDPPRLIEIFPMFNRKIPNGTSLEIRWKGRCMKPVPVTSRVCKESRGVFEKTYTKILFRKVEEYDCHQQFNCPHQRRFCSRIFINPLIDTFFIHMDCNCSCSNTRYRPGQGKEARGFLGAFGQCFKERFKAEDPDKLGIRKIAIHSSNLPKIFIEFPRLLPRIKEVPGFNEFPALKEVHLVPYDQPWPLIINV